MTQQKDIFKDSEGDQYFRRNVSMSEGKDDVIDIPKVLKHIHISPNRVLEVGCSNGHRLNQFEKCFNAECYGIDPSHEAIEHGKKEYPHIHLQVGTADVLAFDNDFFDMVVFGFCLYLCDRHDLFKIAFEADRCLSDNGILVIHDFAPPFPYKNKYRHNEGIYSYKMDYSKMFTWNPSYFEIARVLFSHSGFKLRDITDERIAIVVLKKNEKHAYLSEPFV